MPCRSISRGRDNARKIAAALVAVAEAEEACRAAFMEETFIECRAAVRPMTEGIRRAKFHTKRHKEIKVEGKPVGFEVDEGSQSISVVLLFGWASRDYTV